MDTEKLADYLINGKLITILKAGRKSKSIAWIVADYTTYSNFRLHYDESPSPLEKPIGGKLTPREATDGSKVVDEKKKQVAEYLVESFGLTTDQAERVVTEAHEFHPHRN